MNDTRRTGRKRPLAVTAALALGLLLPACGPQQAVDRGQQLFASTSFSPSPSNPFSCATCHAVTAEAPPGPGRRLPGYSLYGVVGRQSFWGGGLTYLLDAVSFCLVTFMRGDPLGPDDESGKALLVYLGSLSPAPSAPRPLTVVRNIDAGYLATLTGGSASRGEGLYGAACAPCHGAIHSGDGRLSSSVSVVPEDTIAAHGAGQARAIIAEKVRHGKFFGIGGNMPPFSLETISDPELSDLLAYLFPMIGAMIGAVTSPRRPYHALRHRDFRWLGIAQLVSLTGSQMQVVAINWHIYLLTRSPLMLGLVGLTRVLPIILFSLWGGIIADRRDRRWVMFSAQSAMTAIALGLAALTFARGETVWLIYLLNALGAAATAFDAPARQALVPRLVPPEDLPGALALNLSFFHTAMIAGPALAGLIIAGSAGALLPHAPALLAGGADGTGRAGLAWIYLLNAVSFVAVLLALLTLRTSGKPAPGATTAGGRPEHPLVALRDGLRFVFTTPLMVWTMALDFFATFFAGAMSLLPIFADQVLHVGAAGYGLLVAAPAIGALSGSLYTSIRPLPRRQGKVLLYSVGAYGLSTVLFGLSRSYWLTFLGLVLCGLSDLVSTVVRQTLRQLITPDGLRGRMTSVNMIFFMGGPQLGELEAGLVASLFTSAALGATVSVVSGGLLTLGTAVVVGAVARLVRDYDIDQPAGSGSQG